MRTATVTPAAPMPLLTDIPSHRCDRCADLGIRFDPAGKIIICPVVQLGHRHAEPKAAAQFIQRACRSLAFRKLPVNPLAFDVARALSYASTTAPVSRQTLITKYFGWASHQKLRKFHEQIEELRSVWLLPVGSRKQEPFGYWIITEESDYKEWFDRTKRSPITQLSTLHRNAKANFPLLAEQLELDFWKDMATESPPPYEGGVAAASADGVVLSVTD